MILYRRAEFKDVETMHKLTNDYAAQGLMLPRSRNALYESLRDVIVAEEDSVVVGMGALHIVWDELAEIRALAISPDYTGQGIGRKIVEDLMVDAVVIGAKTLFTLTYQTGFFAKLGFTEIAKESLPQKVWKECINCSKFPNCDEVAMVRYLPVRTGDE